MNTCQKLSCRGERRRRRRNPGDVMSPTDLYFFQHGRHVCTHTEVLSDQGLTLFAALSPLRVRNAREDFHSRDLSPRIGLTPSILVKTIYSCQKPPPPGTSALLTSITYSTPRYRVLLHALLPAVQPLAAPALLQHRPSPAVEGAFAPLAPPPAPLCRLSLSSTPTLGLTPGTPPHGA